MFGFSPTLDLCADEKAKIVPKKFYKHFFALDSFVITSQLIETDNLIQLRAQQQCVVEQEKVVLLIFH